MIHNNEVISIEEDLLNCRLIIRQFTFNNRNNNLKIGILTIGASLVSCELDSHQIIANVSNGNNCEQSSGSSVSQLSHNSRTNWVSHVRGLDTLSLTTGISSSQSQSIVYQLTLENELIVIGKFKTQLQLFNPHFFNLNSVTNKLTLEGHYLHVKSSDSSALIRQQINTNTSDENEINFLRDTPCAIPQPLCDSNGSDFDATYILTNGSNPEVSLMAILQYDTRIVKVILQNMHNSQQTSNNSNIKLRVRITNGAVCIMPTMMNEFKCVYKFIW